MSKPGRSPQYLAYIRLQPCVGCVHGTPIEAHHFGPRGVGQKADDLHAVPLCVRCHAYFHSHGTLPDLTRVETERDFYAAQCLLLVAWHWLTRGTVNSGVDDAEVF